MGNVWWQSQWFWAAVTVALAVSDYAVFILAPKWAQRKAAQGDRDGAITLLRRVLRLPSVAGEGVKTMARYVLGLLLTNAGDHAGAVEQWQTLLAHGLPAPSEGVAGLEADVRRRLADSLDTLGRRAEADMERQRGKDSLAGETETPLSLLSRGKLLKQEGKHTEAYAAFERGLSLIKPNKKAERVEFMAQLMRSAFNSGRQAECCEWAEAAIANGARDKVRIVCHQMAGVGYGNRGEIEQARAHYQTALELAEKAGDETSANESRTSLANMGFLQGQVMEAIEVCTHVIQTTPNPSRTGYIVKSLCLQALGRFDEAMEIMHKAREIPTMKTPRAQWRSDAVKSLAMAQFASKAGRSDEALNYLREAAEELSKDEKLGLAVAATGANIHAQRGNSEDSLPLRDVALKNLPQFSGDRSLTLDIYSQLIQAAYHLQEWTQCRQMWQAYLAFKPYPVWLSIAYYYLGECARMEGDFAQAAELYRQAQSVNPDLHFARLAAERGRDLPL